MATRMPIDERQNPKTPADATGSTLKGGIGHDA
jgi:hypothetical protein